MRRVFLYIIAGIFIIGGIMGLMKAIIPDMDWLSFRYLLHGDGTYAVGKIPLYARIYGCIMAIMEIGMAVIILLWKKNLFAICIVVIGINILGCLVAVLLGDIFSIVSLLLRVIPLYFIIEEYWGNKEKNFFV